MSPQWHSYCANNSTRIRQTSPFVFGFFLLSYQNILWDIFVTDLLYGEYCCGAFLDIIDCFHSLFCRGIDAYEQFVHSLAWLC